MWKLQYLWDKRRVQCAEMKSRKAAKDIQIPHALFGTEKYV